MSWSGPLPGAAPLQAPPYPNGQLGYGQHQPYQYGQQPPYNQYQQGPPFAGHPQRPQDNRPPKKKGNPVITRYPPPPGYRGPAQPHGSFNGHQPHAQYPPASQPGFPLVPQFPPNYPGPVYTAAPPHLGYPAPARGLPQPPSYPPSHQPAQNHAWPPQAHQPNQPQVSAYSGGQIHASQTSYQPYPAHTVATDPNQQAYSQAPGWSHAQTQSAYQPQKQYNSYGSSVPGVQPANAIHTPTAASAPPSSAHPTQSISHDGKTTHKSELYLAWDDWDFDFDGAIWPKGNEPVDPNLSLGVIIWHPAKQATRALPATFEEAEEQSLRPTPETLDNGESVSVYFTAENSHEAFLDVRQTDAWEYIKDDPIFVLFTEEEMQHNLVPIEDCISQRDRSDEPLEPDTNTTDAEMHEADWSVMDNLEQALSARGGEAESTQPQTQEDILASLGVTGLPKPVSQETMLFPMPVREPRSAVSLSKEPDLSLRATTTHQPQPPRTRSLSSTRVIALPSAPQRPYGSMSSSSLSRPPPPPPPVEHDRYDPWNPSHRRQQYHTNGFNGGRGSPARSEASNGTAAGSDFGTEKGLETQDISLTPGSKFERSDSSVSRKRSYGDTDADDDRLRQHDDHTKRKRRSLVDAAYGRR